MRLLPITEQQRDDELNNKASTTTSIIQMNSDEAPIR